MKSIVTESASIRKSHEPTERRPNVRDKEATTASILTAAESEFARYGLRGARLDVIATTAGVTKGLVLYYFKSKEKLFEAVLHQASDPLRAVLTGIESSDEPPDVLLHTLTRRFLRVVISRPLTHAIFMLDSIQNNGEYYRKLKMPSIYKTFEQVLDKGVKQGCFCELDTAHTAINIVGLCLFYFFSANLRTGPNSLDSMSEDALEGHVKDVLRFIEARVSPVRNSLAAKV